MFDSSFPIPPFFSRIALSVQNVYPIPRGASSSYPPRFALKDWARRVPVSATHGFHIWCRPQVDFTRVCLRRTRLGTIFLDNTWIQQQLSWIKKPFRDSQGQMGCSSDKALTRGRRRIFIFFTPNKSFWCSNYHKMDREKSSGWSIRGSSQGWPDLDALTLDFL